MINYQGPGKYTKLKTHRSNFLYLHTVFPDTQKVLVLKLFKKFDIYTVYTCAVIEMKCSVH